MVLLRQDVPRLVTVFASLIVPEKSKMKAIPSQAVMGPYDRRFDPSFAVSAILARSGE
jgi:hypothetical protein